MAYSVRGESSSRSDTFNSTSQCKYDVFLSFAGKDTRLNFTGHLYEAFIRSGIRCFRDDVALPRGENINFLFRAIEDSLCSVLVISQNYAKSSWCLDELQKILESRNILDRWVFPIFYDVNPADVRNQRGSFGEALAELEERFRENTTKVQNWRTALSEIGNLSGWVTRGQHEADLIKNIVGVVWTYLSSKLPSYHDNLVGIDSRVADMKTLLETRLDNDTCFVGIWGMGGVGKTTLARVVFKKISDKFEICCFLVDVKKTLGEKEGLLSLQRKLLSHLKIQNMEISNHYDGVEIIRKFLCEKKVLLVLDDVDDMSQLKNLAESSDWFGKGSRIIITTRDKQLLISCGVDKQRIYEMETMKRDESLQLFLSKAFNKYYPPERDYLQYSESVVEYTGGLPLALEVLGHFFCGKSKAEWINALGRLKQGRLKQISNDDHILEVLRISYEGLRNEEEKTIFLDIACFFKGWRRKEVTKILDNCDLHAATAINVLIQKTLLVETKDCRLEMHDLLEDLGKYIVCQESPNDVGKRSRLWKFEDVKEVLENNKGSEVIQAIVLPSNQWGLDRIKVHPKAFPKMTSMRLLQLNMRSIGPLSLSSGLELSGVLKVVRWESFPLDTLPLPLDKLVHIEMVCSKINRLWNGIQFMRTLKFINLSGSLELTETPEFSGVPCLEHLDLSCCTSLVKVHPSLGELNHLVEVYLINCTSLEVLPRKLETNSLITLDLRGCRSVAVLPDFREGMKRLSCLYVSRTAITRLPESLGSLIGLSKLKLDNLRITHQVSSLTTLRSLTELYLSGCGLNDESIPDDFGSLSSLIVLDLSYNGFVNLPTSCFSSLFRLVFLSLNGCKALKSLPRLPPRLIQLNAFGCYSMEPLSDRQSWSLVASLEHELRRQTKYVISIDDDDDDDDVVMNLKFRLVEPNCLPLRDFCAFTHGVEIPQWFPSREEFYHLQWGRFEYEIKLYIPPCFRDSKWSGVVVCIHSSRDLGNAISWSSKAAKDDDYIFNEWAHLAPTRSGHNLCIMVLELDEKTCWRHLSGHNDVLHIKLSTSYIQGVGWRLLRKEEIQDWCCRNDFNQVTQPQLHSPNDVMLPSSVLGKFIGKVDEDVFY